MSIGPPPAADPPPYPPSFLNSAQVTGHESAAAMEEAAAGILAWRAALVRGLLPDDPTLRALAADPDAPLGEALSARAAGAADAADALAWPAAPLRATLIRDLARLGAPRAAAKFPAVLEALLRTLVEATTKYEKVVGGVVDAVLAEDADAGAPAYTSARDLARQETERRAARAAASADDPAAAAAAAAASAAAAANAAASAVASASASPSATADEDEDDGPTAAERAAWPLDKKAAEGIAGAVVKLWEAPLRTLAAAGRAFDGLEALLGGGAFELGAGIWRRKGWAEMDAMRARLEDLKELRDLVRSLGRGGGWGPLRRAPTQKLDMRGRPGLLRTTLEAQETRGLTRSDDISRLLPSEAALLARGRVVRQAKLLFYAKLAEKALSTYERDGWGEYDTTINPDRLEIRPTADRGPILLCVDTSGSMRGAREVVAKALVLECMRAAKVQERGCFVFAFAGPDDVAELELGIDAASVDRLLTFLEKVFNGGSDFNTPIARCLGRLTDKAWANSDILIVSDGELRQPAQEVMRKLAGAKDKLGLRVHGLVVGTPGKQRADPAVLRSLCSSIAPNGRSETLVHTFESWASVEADDSLGGIDWDDAAGDASRRAAGLALEKMREDEMRRRRVDNKHLKVKAPPSGGRKK